MGSEMCIRDSSLNIGSEVQIHPKLGLHMEAGLVSHLVNPLYAYINMQNADNYKNWGGKGKLSLRYYFKRRNSGPDVFIGPSIAHTQHSNSQMGVDLGAELHFSRTRGNFLNAAPHPVSS